MKKFSTLTVLVLIVLFISSCSIVETTYSFYHHGTESINTNSNFKYVGYNVIGKAKTTYYPNKLRKQQERAKDGLIADAKDVLHRDHPLSNNQAYANLSIDVLETIKGTPSQARAKIREITIEVVVSADIIEYY